MEKKPPKPPVLNEVASIKDGRDITRGWVDALLLEPQDPILLGKGYGDLKVYEEVARDDQVASCLQQRFSAVVSCEWEVLPGGEKRIDQQAADFLAEQLHAVDWDGVTEKQLWGRFYGFSVAECLWRRDADRIVFDDSRGGIRVRDRRRFRFDPDMRLRLLTSRDMTRGELLPPSKFWVFCAGADHHDDPYGRALGYWLYWPTFLKRHGIRFWLRFLETLAKGRRVGKYAPGTSKEDQDKLLRAAYALGEDGAAVFPEGMSLELLEVASQTGDYNTLREYCDGAIAKIILSQTMTTDNGSSLSQAEVHEGVARRLVKADADLICQSFNRSVARWLTDWNFPGAAYPMVWRKVEEPENLKEQAEIDEKIITWGFSPKPEYIVATYGDNWQIPAPAEPRPALSSAQLQDLMQLLGLVGQGQLGTDALRQVLKMAFPSIEAEQIEALVEAVAASQPAPGDEPDEPEAPDEPEVTFAQREAPSTPDLYLQRLRSEGSGMVSEWVGALEGLLSESSNLEAFRAGLDEIFPNLDSDGLAALMAEALSAARLAGIYEAQEEAGGDTLEFKESWATQARDRLGRWVSSGGLSNLAATAATKGAGAAGAALGGSLGGWEGAIVGKITGDAVGRLVSTVTLQAHQKLSRDETYRTASPAKKLKMLTETAISEFDSPATRTKLKGLIGNDIEAIGAGELSKALVNAVLPANLGVPAEILIDKAVNIASAAGGAVAVSKARTTLRPETNVTFAEGENPELDEVLDELVDLILGGAKQRASEYEQALLQDLAQTFPDHPVEELLVFDIVNEIHAGKFRSTDGKEYLYELHPDKSYLAEPQEQP